MPDPRPKSVLVVDDEPMVTTSLRSFLELETPYRVLTFSNPLKALAHDLDALPRLVNRRCSRPP